MSFCAPHYFSLSFAAGSGPYRLEMPDEFIEEAMNSGLPGFDFLQEDGCGKALDDPDAYVSVYPVEVQTLAAKLVQLLLLSGKEHALKVVHGKKGPNVLSNPMCGITGESSGLEKGFEHKNACFHPPSFLIQGGKMLVVEVLAVEQVCKQNLNLSLWKFHADEPEFDHIFFGSADSDLTKRSKRTVGQGAFHEPFFFTTVEEVYDQRAKVGFQAHQAV